MIISVSDYTTRIDFWAMSAIGSIALFGAPSGGFFRILWKFGTSDNVTDIFWSAIPKNKFAIDERSSCRTPLQ